jgi:hypothetical protein
MMPEQPRKGAPHKCHTTLSRQIPMRNQHTLDRPSENPVECRSRRTAVEETRAPITPRATVSRFTGTGMWLSALRQPPLNDECSSRGSPSLG